jgi:hypothetical protein
MRAFHEQEDFKSLLLSDRDLAAVVGREVVEKAFDLDDQLRNVDAIFDRVFGRAPEPAVLAAGQAGREARQSS